jgi:hypothetical protein
MSTPLTTEQILTTATLKKDRTVAFVPMSAAGGVLPYTFTITPALPLGLSLNLSTGQIRGAARTILSATVYTVIVSDSASNSSSQSFILTIEPSPNKSDPDGKIAAADYNYLRTEIRAIIDDLGRNNPGSRSSAGYGQLMQSSEISAGTIIAKQHWDNLRNDLINIGLHQTGVEPTIVSATDPVLYSASAPNYRYQDLAQSFFATRFNIGVGRSVINQRDTISRTGSWNTECSTVLTVTFPGYIRSGDSTVISNIDHARYFFNAGGKIRFTSSRTGGDTTAQNKAWSDLLSRIGTVQFGGNIVGPLSFYKLTNIYQEFYRANPEISQYTVNSYTIDAKCNVANNSSGGATQIDFRITWVDGYTDPDDISGSSITFGPTDEVNGTLSLLIEDAVPFGTMVPSGTFIVPNPNYSYTPIEFV